MKRGAARGAALGAAAGAGLGLLDALRARLEPGSVLPPSASPFVVLVYAAAWAPAGAILGALLSEATAAGAALAGAAALGAGLAANHYLLPAFTDPISLAGDGAILLGALLGTAVLRRRFARRGTPGPGTAAAMGAGALGLSLLLALGGGRDDGPRAVASRSAEGPAPDVLLVVVDTLRADAVCFPWTLDIRGRTDLGHDLSDLAGEGAVFTCCRAPSSWTKPSTASLLTGRYPAEHGALGFESVLPGEATTLAEVLRSAGWRTSAFADNPFVSPEFGFAQGFDAFTGRHPSPLARGTLLLKAASQVRLRVAGGAAYSFGPGVDLGARRVMGEAVEFLLAGGDRPSFAYAHLIEPHYPYAPPPPHDGGRRVDPPHSSGILPFDTFPGMSAEDLQAMRWNYAGEVKAAFEAIRGALDRLRKAGRLDRTLVVITSDHGEEFHEHGGWTHGQSLYEELVRVPLILRRPGAEGWGRQVDAPVSLVDVVPTVLDLCGVAAGARFSGRSLAPLLRGEALPPVPHYAEIESGPVGARALFLGREALIVARKSGREAAGLFDLSRDPGQRVNLLDAGGVPAGLADRMRSLLDAGFEAQAGGALRRTEQRMDDETRRALEALGYGGR